MEKKKKLAAEYVQNLYNQNIPSILIKNSITTLYTALCFNKKY